MLLATKNINTSQRLLHNVLLLLACRFLLLRERNELLSCVLHGGWSQVAELLGRRLFAADLAGTDTHACSQRKAKPSMQQRYIHTSFGGFPLRCLLSLSLTLSPLLFFFFEQCACFLNPTHTLLHWTALTKRTITKSCIPLSVLCLPVRKSLFMWGSCY